MIPFSLLTGFVTEARFLSNADNVLALTAGV